MTGPARRRTPLVLLRVAPWCVALAGLASAFVLPGPVDGPVIRTSLLLTVAAFFVLLLVRLVVTAVRTPPRRPALLLLAGGIALWAAGSAILSATQTTTEAVAFPAPGEALYLVSYLGIVAFLLLDVPRRRLPVATVWLEAAVVCSGAACLSAFAVITPLSASLDGDAVDLLIALLYPLVDLLLAVVVVAQLALGMRERSWRTSGLVLAFVVLAVADSSLVVHGAGAGQYTSSVVLELLWGGSFGLLVSSACRPRPTEGTQQAGGNGTLLLLAALVALVVLVLRPDGPLGLYVTVPAVIALVCTGVRMVVALREARGAAEALRLSLTDELTGLPNRRSLLATADEWLRDGADLGLLLLDLDGFKDVNDSLGHQVGDQVLVLMAQRMQAGLDPEVFVARLGGDEFALLARGADELTLHALARSVHAVVRAPMRMDSLDLALDASIGISTREHGDTATELLRRADIAMYQAKETRAGTLLFDPAQDGFSRDRLRRGEELRHAIADDQLVVWYQPQIDARTNVVVAVEALVRWQHPVEGLLGPMAFLPDARRAGLMPALTGIVTRAVVRDARRWADAGETFRAAINWAPPELLAAPVLDGLFDELARSGLPPGRIMIEVTEDSFVAEPERAREVLLRLRDRDVQTSIDDYGTGFSSLAYLRDLPVHELKIDRSFVSTLTRDAPSEMIVRTTTQMAHGLGMRLVAEGVEDQETAAALRALGVDVLQGYVFAVPMPAEEVLGWVEAWRRRSAAGRFRSRLVAGSFPGGPAQGAEWAV